MVESRVCGSREGLCDFSFLQNFLAWDEEVR